MSTRLLFITSCNFSQSEANGHTLESLFSYCEKKDIAQFYVRESKPDFGFCNQYFHVSDRDMVRCFWSCSGGAVKEPSVRKTPLIPQKRRKDAFVLIARNLLWKASPWKRKTRFYDWVNSFKPECLVAMIGENWFVMDIVLDLHRRLGIPILFFNTEGYYFSSKNYFERANFLGKIAYPIYRMLYRKNFSKLMSETSYVMYLCKKLQDDYGKQFPVPSRVIYTPSKNTTIPEYCSKRTGKDIVISYIGTLGYGRHKTLINLGEELYRRKQDVFINIYGKCSDEIASLFRESMGIKYHGLIPFSEVGGKIEDSDILLHAEGFEPKCREMLRYGFSTKIADSLMSGRCFVLVAPNDVACYEYINENIPGSAASSIQEAGDIIERLIDDVDYRIDLACKGRELAFRNHNPAIVGKTVQDIVNSIVK